MCDGRQGVDFFDRVSLGTKQCTRRSDCLAVDTDFITDKFKKAYGNFVQ